jgi:hypothetical protein
MKACKNPPYINVSGTFDQYVTHLSLFSLSCVGEAFKFRQDISEGLAPDNVEHVAATTIS